MVRMLMVSRPPNVEIVVSDPLVTLPTVILTQKVFSMPMGTTEPAALRSFDFRSACAIDCRVFYTSAYGGATETRLRETVGPGAVTAYVNEAGDAIGYAFGPAGKPNDD